MAAVTVNSISDDRDLRSLRHTEHSLTGSDGYTWTHTGIVVRHVAKQQGAIGSQECAPIVTLADGATGPVSTVTFNVATGSATAGIYHIWF